MDKRLTRAEAAALFAAQQAPAPKQRRQKPDPDAPKPGRSMTLAEAAQLEARLVTFADEQARLGVHRWHVAEIMALVACRLHPRGASRGVDQWIADQREARAVTVRAQSSLG